MKIHNAEIDMDAAKTAALIAAVPVILSWLQVENPYFLGERVSRFAIYSATMLLPVIFEILLARMGIGLGGAAFYVMGYIVYLPVFYAAAVLYRRSGNKKLFAARFSAIFLALVTLAVFLLW